MAEELTTHEFARRDGADSPFQLLGRAIEGACDDPTGTTLGLHALVVYAAEYARLHGASYSDFVAALESCIRLHTERRDERIRSRLVLSIHRWAALAYQSAGMT